MLPAGLALGPGRIEVLDHAGNQASATTIDLQRVAPALFTATGNGEGFASAFALQLERDGSLSQSVVARCSRPLMCIAVPIDLSGGRPVYLSLYGTGIRGASSMAAVRVTIADTSLRVECAGPQMLYPGMDQINVPLPPSLRGKGEVDVALTVDGAPANVVRVVFQ